jgi:hypothetical protein
MVPGALEAFLDPNERFTMGTLNHGIDPMPVSYGIGINPKHHILSEILQGNSSTAPSFRFWLLIAIDDDDDNQVLCHMC